MIYCENMFVCVCESISFLTKKFVFFKKMFFYSYEKVQIPEEEEGVHKD